MRARSNCPALVYATNLLIEVWRPGIVGTAVYFWCCLFWQHVLHAIQDLHLTTEQRQTVRKSKQEAWSSVGVLASYLCIPSLANTCCTIDHRVVARYSAEMVGSVTVRGGDVY